MSPAVTLCLGLLAAFALAVALLSMLVFLCARIGSGGRIARSGPLLVLRFLPAAGATLLVVTVILPAFTLYEPSRASENTGPVLVGLAIFTLALFGDAVRRVWRAWRAARLLCRRLLVHKGRSRSAAPEIEIFDSTLPLVAVIGAWQPRIVAASAVLAACTDEEFHMVVAHEMAHVSARDNLKALWLVACPDPLSWLAAGTELSARWRVAAEREADDRAAGADPRRRLMLASALVKVARHVAAADRRLPALVLSIASDDVAGRVRRLLAPSTPPAPPAPSSRLAAISIFAALTLPACAIPFYQSIHRFVEFLVSWGL